VRRSAEEGGGLSSASLTAEAEQCHRSGRAEHSYELGADTRIDGNPQHHAGALGEQGHAGATPLSVALLSDLSSEGGRAYNCSYATANSL
jgi:hypothetical protein